MSETSHKNKHILEDVETKRFKKKIITKATQSIAVKKLKFARMKTTAPKTKLKETKNIRCKK